MPPAWGPSDGPGGPPPGTRPGMTGPGGPPPGSAMNPDDQGSEMGIENLRSTVKKARWNVFMYLGIAAMMFAFALIPLPVPAPWDDETELTDDVSGGELQQELPYLFGMPVDGRDATDVRLVLEVVPKDGGTFHVHVIEAHCGTNTITNELIEFETAVAKNESFDSTHRLYVDSIPAKSYEMEFKLDPGGYCLVVEYEHPVGHSLGSLEVTASVYGLREIGGGLGGIALLWATFGFIGAQRKGKILKEKTSVHRGSMSVEEEVMEETTQAIITAGPGSPPTEDLPMESAYAAQPAQQPAPTQQPAPVQQMPPAYAPVSTLNYIESGDGYHYILRDDNSFDPQPYIKQSDGTYVPFSG